MLHCETHYLWGAHSSNTSTTTMMDLLAKVHLVVLQPKASQTHKIQTKPFFSASHLHLVVLLLSTFTFSVVL